jgi:transposase
VAPRRKLVGHEAVVVAAYRGGATVEELAERYDCSTTTVRSVLRAEGADTRARGPRSPLEGREAEVAAAYVAGGTVRGLAEHFGANGRTICKVLADQGVPMRSRGRRPVT